jgi:hypothetical protein
MSRLVRTRLLLLVLFTLLPRSSGAAGLQPRAGTSAYEKLRLTRVEAPSLKNSGATQFLAADTKGHPWLLRGDTLEVFRLGGDASFDHRVGKLACSLSSGSAYAAAMDPGGSTWAVSSLDDLSLCDFTQERHPAGFDAWVVSSLTYSRSGPLVVVAGIGPPSVGGVRFKTKEPRVFGLVDGRWQPVAWAPIVALTEMPADPMNLLAETKARDDSLICTAPKDAIWLASWNSYRLQKLSATVKPAREIVVGTGKVEWQKLDQKEQEREARGREAQGAALHPAFALGTAAPRPVVRALLCGREGVLYLVVSTDDGLALDRFDPSRNVLERVLLDGARVSSGPMTAALGADQLWLGGRFAGDGLWRISLNELAAAHWKPVQGVRADGQPVE